MVMETRKRLLGEEHPNSPTSINLASTTATRVGGAPGAGAEDNEVGAWTLICSFQGVCRPEAACDVAHCHQLACRAYGPIGKHSITSAFSFDGGMFVFSIEFYDLHVSTQAGNITLFSYESTVMVHCMMNRKYGLLLTNTSSLPTHPYIPPANPTSSQRCSDKSPFFLSPASPHAPPTI